MCLSLEEKIGQMIVVGFHGTEVDDPWVIKLRAQIVTSRVGGVVLFTHNIENKKQIKRLTNYFAAIETTPSQSHRSLTPFICLDQEGGKVQRLNHNNGFTDFPSAREVAATKSPAQARTLYAAMAQEIKDAGFNLVFAPVVDLDPALPTPPCPVIGGMGRNYGNNVAQVIKYAAAFSDAMRAAALLTALKHFPGHGSAHNDTHLDIADVTHCWQENELQPFYALIKTNKARAIMTAHLINKNLDQEYPATLSEKILGSLLRKKGNFTGMIISDDLHMGAILRNYGLEQTVIQCLKAGVDLMVFSNNPAAAKGMTGFRPDPELPEKVIAIVKNAISAGVISEELIHQSYARRCVIGIS